jgi:homoserine O-acetyltransferase
VTHVVATGQRPLRLRNGSHLTPVALEVATWGKPNRARDNAVLVCHSFSADAHAAGHDGSTSATWRSWRQGRVGWWDDLIGPGKAIDTDRWWVICSNVIGGSGGSTGPDSIDVATGLPWHDRFPRLHITDIVAAQQRLMEQLDIPRWRLVTGGSLGGIQALTWAIAGGNRVERVVAIAAAASLAPMGRTHFRSGAERIAAALATGADGLRALHETLAGAQVFSGGPVSTQTASHHQTTADELTTIAAAWPAERFSPRTYLALSQALLDYDLAHDWGDGDLDAAVRPIRADVTLLGYPGDRVFTPTAQTRLAAAIRRTGGHARAVALAGSHGHDSFLLEQQTLIPWLRRALA